MQRILDVFFLLATFTGATFGYELIGRHGYFSFEEEATAWKDAIAACLSVGAELWVPKSKQEQADVLHYVFETLRVPFDSVLWVAGHDVFEENFFLNLQGNRLNASGLLVWSANEPDGGLSSNCVQIDARGEYRDERCTSGSPYVCKIPLWKKEYHFYPDMGYYRLHEDVKSWFEARKECQREGTDLAVVNSEKEAFVLFDMLQRVNSHNRSSFVGVHDQFAEGFFMTIGGVPLENTGFAEFNGLEPDNALGKENCLVLRPTGKLGDVPCDVQYQFFCEHTI